MPRYPCKARAPSFPCPADMCCPQLGILVAAGHPYFAPRDARCRPTTLRVCPQLEDADLRNGSANGAATKPKGVLGSFVSSLAMRVVGTAALTAADLEPALEEMKKKLMERNVAEAIAQKICDSVGASLEGKKLSSFTGEGAAWGSRGGALDAGQGHEGGVVGGGAKAP
jgi:hypothetical protein